MASEGLTFDDSIRDLLRLKDEKARETIGEISDVLKRHSSLSHSFKPAICTRKELTAPQAWSRVIMSIASRFQQRSSFQTFVGRVRPKTGVCSSGVDDLVAQAPPSDEFCQRHLAAFTGAGLMCSLAEESRTRTLYEKLVVAHEQRRPRAFAL